MCFHSLAPSQRHARTRCPCADRSDRRQSSARSHKQKQRGGATHHRACSDSTLCSARADCCCCERALALERGEERRVSVRRRRHWLLIAAPQAVEQSIAQSAHLTCLRVFVVRQLPLTAPPPKRVRTRALRLRHPQHAFAFCRREQAATVLPHSLDRRPVTIGALAALSRLIR